ncbi:MAG: DUF4625 domain-containing protein [Dysgonamonadaceae bacterium]|jgi:hypothetical protein|nr:DUF4625 domain-containing protein [Dysgonamonadaceae bacterium]
MKAKNVFFICLAAFSPIVLNSCKEDSDVEKPVITLIEPAEGDALQIGGEHGVHFEAEFSDNEMLASYKVNIHPDFDDHTHARTRASSEPTVDFEYEQSWTISGKNASIHHHEITIPENATPGDYHLMVYCTDAAGNESHIAVDVELSHEAGEGHAH